MGLKIEHYLTPVCTECWNNTFDITCINQNCPKSMRLNRWKTYIDKPIIWVNHSNISPINMAEVKKEYQNILVKRLETQVNDLIKALR